MDPQQIERFFILYLEEVQLKYSITNKIFTVKLDKTHKKLYSREKDLVCTFDATTSQKHKVPLLGLGVFIIDSIVAKYADEITLATLRVPLNEDDIFEVDDNLPSLNEKAKYLISEVEQDCTYIRFETYNKSAKNNATVHNSVLVTPECVISAKNIEQSLFEDRTNKLSLDTSQIEKGLEFIREENTKVFEEAENQHYKDVAELKKIQTEHATSQYGELEAQENQLLNKMEQARVNSIRTASFDTKAKWNHKIKELKVKHNKLLDKNTAKRAKIKRLFDKQIDELSVRELDAKVDIKVYAQMQMRYFRVEYDNNKTYLYIPILKRFIQINNSQESSNTQQ